MSLAQLIRRTPMVRRILAGPLAVRRRLLDERQRPARDVLERFERLVTSDVRIAVPQFEGEFLLGPRSHLLHRLLAEGSYEPALVRLFLSHVDPDRDVIDIGANVGFFTVLAAKHLATGRVFAAEPAPAAHVRLRQNIALNGVADKVIVYEGLVSDRESVETINIVTGREEYSSMGAIVHPSVASEPVRSEEIQARPLDALVKENGLRPALIKVDVEGAEGMVFGGAEETLRTMRPVVISELSRPLLECNGSSPEAVLALFERYDYDVRDPHDPRAKPGHRDFTDILAVPR